jgi:hypothetical protein
MVLLAEGQDLQVVLGYVALNPLWLKNKQFDGGGGQAAMDVEVAGPRPRTLDQPLGTQRAWSESQHGVGGASQRFIMMLPPAMAP